VLTTLGVIFGTLVLTFSLSLGQGPRKQLIAKRAASTFCGRFRSRRAGMIPMPLDEEVRVLGEMSADRRERIRQALVTQKHQASARNRPPIALTQERLLALSQLEHVESVTPVIGQQGWVILGDRSQAGWTSSAAPDSPASRRRIIAGDFFREADERSMVLSELTCYLLGVTDDAALKRLVGTESGWSSAPSRPGRACGSS